MRVLIVDDSAFMRQAIRSMLEKDTSIEVVGIARNGREGLELAEKLKPDVMTLDIEMPIMDGLTALRRIMATCPTQVIMLSSLTTEGSHAALTALKLGAADFLAKDSSQFSLSITNIQAELIAKVKALGGRRRSLAQRVAPPARMQALPTYRSGQFDVICIGSSTGGPPQLEKILSQAPADISAPIVVAQHMPEVFTQSLSERLNDMCALPVLHAEDGMPLESRKIYIARGSRNIHIHKRSLAKYELRVNDEPKEAVYHPNVSALFESAAHAMRSRVLGIVLTGIGDDGLKGGRAIKQIGGQLLAQNEESCVVYGMPKAVTQAGIVDASLSPDQIAQVVVGLGSSAGSARRAG